MRPTIKFLQTGDIHLGAKFLSLGNRGPLQRQQLRETFSALIQLAIQEKVDLVLIAGDTFDSNQPSVESLQSYRQGLQSLADHHIPLLTIGGTHDPLNAQSVLKRLVALKLEGLVVLESGKSVWCNQAQTIRVQGISLLATDNPNRPLSLLQRQDFSGWQVGMIHAGLEMGHAHQQEATFSTAEVAASQLDYLAVGHWHNPKNCSSGPTACWYAGTPEMIALDESEAGSVLIVRLEEGKTPTVTPHRIGKRSLHEMSLENSDSDTMLKIVMPYADPNRILDLTIHGVLSPEQLPDIQWLKLQLENSFFKVHIRNATAARFTNEEIASYPETTVAGRFIRMLKTQLENAPAEERAELEKCLQLGMALLSGREVYPWS